MESSSPVEPQRKHSETIVSPSLRKDLHRLKLLSPLLILLLLAAIAYGIGFFATGLVVGPQQGWTRPIATARRFGLSPQTVAFKAADGTSLKAWWERAWSVPVPKGAVILVHGFQTNKTGMAYVAAKLLAQGFSVLVLDLRGHGESGGSYATFGYKEALDVEAAVRWVRGHESADRIALLGYSSGAVASLIAAAQTPEVVAVVADSAYLDVDDVLQRECRLVGRLPSGVQVPWQHRLRLWLFTTPGFSWLSRAVFRVREGVAFEPPEASVLGAVERIANAHVLYLAADHDPLVPRAVTERLYRATASSHKQISIMPGTAHSALRGDPRAYATAVNAFLADAFDTAPGPEPALDAANRGPR